jgi:ubiquitin C-terminal hydrolase
MNDYLMNRTVFQNTDDTVLTIEWKMLYKLMKDNNVVISPNRFIHQCRALANKKNRDEFAGMEQNDAIDYFYFAIECFHNSLNLLDESVCQPRTNVQFINDYLDKTEKSDKSIISRLFTSCILYNYVECDTNEKAFYKIEHGFTIELSIPSQSRADLMDCFRETWKDDILDGDNMWYDEKNNVKKAVRKQTFLCYLPEIMVIHLKRWGHDLNKNKAHVDVPFVLDISTYSLIEDSCKYELFGIINHEGCVMGGHYFSYVKKGGDWYVFNDASFHKIQTSTVNTSKNYCMFYRKIK